MVRNSQIISSDRYLYEGKWTHIRVEQNSDKGGTRTHDLWILITVAPLADLKGQSRSRLWVLEILYHSIEESNLGICETLAV